MRFIQEPCARTTLCSRHRWRGPNLGAILAANCGRLCPCLHSFHSPLGGASQFALLRASPRPARSRRLSAARLTARRWAAGPSAGCPTFRRMGAAARPTPGSSRSLGRRHRIFDDPLAPSERRLDECAILPAPNVGGATASAILSLNGAAASHIRQSSRPSRRRPTATQPAPAPESSPLPSAANRRIQIRPTHRGRRFATPRIVLLTSAAGRYIRQSSHP
jgi:hypothetical protein